MAKNAIYTVSFRRKREGRTHYKKRLELLKSNKVRLVIRRSNTATLLQFIQYQPDGDKVLVTFNSAKLSTYGWDFSKKSLPAAYLAGLAAGALAKKAGVNEAILDMGLQTPMSGSKVYAALKGVIDAGVDVPSSNNIFPSEERISGKHIEDAKNLHDTFTGYKKAKLDASKMTEVFAKVKEKILGN
jgi:large subunit ribosomal protein L18